MSHSLLRALRARGIDVVTALDVGMIGRSDAEHLEFATSQQRVLCTFNISDFYRLHTARLMAGEQHSGIILIPQQRFATGELLRRLLKLASARSAEAMRGRAEFLSGWG